MDYKALMRPGIINTMPYRPGKPIEEVERELGLSNIVKLASNENPEPPLPEVLTAIQGAAQTLNRYPDGACFALTKALAEHLKVEPQSLMLGNGSNEVIDMLIRALVSPGENVVYAHPSFVVYPITCGIHFECGRAVPLDKHDSHDLPAMAAAVDDQTKLLFICNPNNPTGTYTTQAELDVLMSQVPEHVMVVLDEAYYEYVTAQDYPDTLPMLARYPNLIVLRTFSKIHSLAGLRLGYMVGHPDLVAELHKTREPFNVNSIAQAAAMACIDRWDVVAGRRERNAEHMASFGQALAGLGFEVTPSQANFLLVRHAKPAGWLCGELLKKGVIVRPMDRFGLGDGALRISVGLPQENAACIAALTEILA
ncbi:histidinol-phosphate transaminase [Magnetococcus sp. PR-3]|uniref:histidinol-phosphate transaminase n=1 Tax=Magnetococcus sp. PR-3 TaxID=3120355 RepID=UPI002FCE58E5